MCIVFQYLLHNTYVFPRKSWKPQKFSTQVWDTFCKQSCLSNGVRDTFRKQSCLSNVGSRVAPRAAFACATLHLCNRTICMRSAARCQLKHGTRRCKSNKSARTLHSVLRPRYFPLFCWQVRTAPHSPHFDTYSRVEVGVQSLWIHPAVLAYRWARAPLGPHSTYIVSIFVLNEKSVSFIIPMAPYWRSLFT